MTEEDDLAAVRGSLSDLLPDYRGPADPLLRVTAGIRRRRARRALLVAGSAAAAAALVVGLPAGLGAMLPAAPGGQPAVPGGPPTKPGGLPAGAPTGTATGSPVPMPPLYPVNRGALGGAAWKAGSISPGGAARRCLLVDGAGFNRHVTCFDDWRPGDPLSWDRLVVGSGARAATRVAGVAPADADEVVVERSGGPAVHLPTVGTPTDYQARFFAVVLAGDVQVRSVTALRDRQPLGPPVTEPAVPTCRPSPDNACASPWSLAAGTGGAGG